MLNFFDLYFIASLGGKSVAVLNFEPKEAL